MAEKRYVCTGECQGSVSEEEYKQGKNKCAAPDCDKHGEPLELRFHCKKCGVNYREGVTHNC